jgi:hypothetical protein
MSKGRAERVAYLSPEAYANPPDPGYHRKGWKGFLSGLEQETSRGNYDDLVYNYHWTCGDAPRTCAWKGCFINKGALQFTVTRFDYNYHDNTWYQPQVFCCACAPTSCILFHDEPIDLANLPDEAKPLVKLVMAAAWNEPIVDPDDFMLEMTASELKAQGDAEQIATLRAYNKYWKKGRSLPEQVLAYCCTDEAMLKPRPWGKACHRASYDPFTPPFFATLPNGGTPEEKWLRLTY